MPANSKYVSPYAQYMAEMRAEDRAAQERAEVLALIQRFQVKPDAGQK